MLCSGKLTFEHYYFTKPLFATYFSLLSDILFTSNSQKIELTLANEYLIIT